MDATFIACLTPAGTAAIATLAVRGPSAWSITRQLFRKAAPRGISASPLPDEPSAGQSWFGRLEATAADEVVLVVKRGLPFPWLEIHCHGGVQIVQMLQEAFLRQGARLCTWQELERKSSTDAVRMLAQEYLVQAPTVRTAAILLDQYQGAFSRVLTQIEQHLHAGGTDAAKALLDKLHRNVSLGRHLVEPWRVVIGGVPNVGKSSLVNALAGYTRSVVSATPGTTRDVVTTRLAIDGWPVELADTAGWREQAEPLEQQGIARAGEVMAEADLIVWVVDGTMLWPKTKDPRLIHVLNKIDLSHTCASGPGPPQAVRVSSYTGEGIPELCQRISTRLVPEPPAPGDGVPFTPELCACLAQARQLVGQEKHREAAGVIGRWIGLQ